VTASFLPPTEQIVVEAEGIVWAERWRLAEHAAAERLARRAGLGWAQMFPSTRVAHLVTFDGRVLGRVYCSRPRRYNAIVHGGHPDLGCYPTLKAAARALARDAGYRA
jgi:hypothetical protein